MRKFDFSPSLKDGQIKKKVQKERLLGVKNKMGDRIALHLIKSPKFVKFFIKFAKISFYNKTNKEGLFSQRFQKLVQTFFLRFNDNSILI